ncbi:Lrp/AsnC family transcriptional regulator [Guptibacillus sedimenti]|uniref:Lrp/AsnC family transcriptional regulator n=1 Tax=Guptibacillus sedimenti TaxID=3025680 RepID=UPI003B5B0B88
MRKLELDELDKGLIVCLSHDGRMSFKDIAEKLQVTEKTIRLRYKKLVDAEVLKVVGIVDPVAVGVKVAAIFQVDVEPSRLQEVVAVMKKYKEVRYITLTSGEYPLMIQTNLPNQEDIRLMVYKLYDIQGIRKVNTTYQFDIFKNTHDIL